ncbi:MAG: hypothetical protein M3Q91_03865, partial [Acidobacteriota bacterium]|nr:hypothetical protein [Acidobacteriota bacterium]
GVLVRRKRHRQCSAWMAFSKMVFYIVLVQGRRSARSPLTRTPTGMPRWGPRCTFWPRLRR